MHLSHWYILKEITHLNTYLSRFNCAYNKRVTVLKEVGMLVVWLVSKSVFPVQGHQLFQPNYFVTSTKLSCIFFLITVDRVEIRCIVLKYGGSCCNTVDHVEIWWIVLKYCVSCWNSVHHVEIHWIMLKYGGSWWIQNATWMFKFYKINNLSFFIHQIPLDLSSVTNREMSFPN